MAKTKVPVGKVKPSVKSTPISKPKSSSKPSKNSKLKPAAKAALSAEFVADSDDEIEFHKVEARKPTTIVPPKIKPVVSQKQLVPEISSTKAPIPIPSESESSEESESEDEESNQIEHNGVTKNDSEIGSERENGDDDDDDDDEKGSESFDDESSSKSSLPSTPTSDKGPVPPLDSRPQPSHSSAVHPAFPFEPPSGYRSVISMPTASRTIDIFRPQNTEDKHIWYITAPANVPVTSLKEIAMDKILKGGPVMTHKEEEYTFTADHTTSRTTSLFLPSAGGYDAAPINIQKVLHLRRVVRLPTVPQPRAGVTSRAVAILPEEHLSIARPKKEQPKGLRMRYQPFGAWKGDLRAVERSDTNEPASSRLEVPSSNIMVNKKRKDRENDTASGEKQKKQKKHSSGERNEDVNTDLKSSKERSKKNKNSAPSSVKTNGVPRENGLVEPKKKDQEKKKKKRDREKV